MPEPVPILVERVLRDVEELLLLDLLEGDLEVLLMVLEVLELLELLLELLLVLLQDSAGVPLRLLDLFLQDLDPGVYLQLLLDALLLLLVELQVILER